MSIGITLHVELPEELKKHYETGKSVLLSADSYVSLDLETTGLDPWFDSIIECAAIKYENGEETYRFHSLINPGRPLDPFITDLTGITDDMLLNAPLASEVLPNLVDFIGDSLIIGHNVKFDLRFLEFESVFLKSDYVDTMRLSRKLWPEYEHHRLSDLRERLLGGERENAHRAAADAEDTAKCYEAMKAECIKRGIDMPSLAYKHKDKLHAKDISTENTEFNIDSQVYGRVFVFTGTLSACQRKDAMQMVVDLGGQCGDNVTAKTNYLVLGVQDYKKVGETGKSSKHRKAEKLKLGGQDIEIISENVFFDMVKEAKEG